MKGTSRLGSLSKILAPVSGDLRMVGRKLTDHVNAICNGQTLSASYKTHVTKMVEHLFKVPGKMLRPALVLLSGKVVRRGDSPSGHALINMAVAVELLHSASLIHDDIIDEADDRRNRMSLNRHSGNHMAVLVGDILYSQFFSALTDLDLIEPDQKLEMFRVFSALTKKMCLGEVYEEKIRQEALRPTVEEYLNIIEHKTASLMSTCCFAGGYLSGADKGTLEILTNFGLNFGLAFQILDDFLDDDSIFHDMVSLSDIAGGYIEKAITEIKQLGINPVVESFCTMSEYIARHIG